MDGNFEQTLAAEEKALDVFQASRALGEAVVETPTYQNFLGALKAINNDPQIQEIAAQMRSHQRALQMGIDGHNHQAELARLQNELEALPIVQEYRKAEQETILLFRALDEFVSQAMGFPFARNARRNGCSCSG